MMRGEESITDIQRQQECQDGKQFMQQTTQLFQGTLVGANCMIAKKEGDQGIEVCSVEDPSPITP